METLLELSDTCPFRASARPLRLAPELREMLVRARIFPENKLPDPIVAELLTCHWTPHGLPPLMIETTAPEEVMSELDIRNTHTALGFPCAFRVRVPVRFEGAAPTQYTPATRVRPVRLGPTGVHGSADKVL